MHHLSQKIAKKKRLLATVGIMDDCGKTENILNCKPLPIRPNFSKHAERFHVSNPQAFH